MPADNSLTGLSPYADCCWWVQEFSMMNTGRHDVYRHNITTLVQESESSLCLLKVTSSDCWLLDSLPELHVLLAPDSHYWPRRLLLAVSSRSSTSP